MVDGPSVSASRYVYEPVEGVGGSIFVVPLPKEAVRLTPEDIGVAHQSGDARRGRAGLVDGGVVGGRGIG